MAESYSLEVEFEADDLGSIREIAFAMAKVFFVDEPFELGNFWIRPAKKKSDYLYKVDVNAFTPREKKTPAGFDGTVPA